MQNKDEDIAGQRGTTQDIISCNKQQSKVDNNDDNNKDEREWREMTMRIKDMGGGQGRRSRTSEAVDDAMWVDSHDNLSIWYSFFTIDQGFQNFACEWNNK